MQPPQAWGLEASRNAGTDRNWLAERRSCVLGKQALALELAPDILDSGPSSVSDILWQHLLYILGNIY